MCRLVRAVAAAGERFAKLQSHNGVGGGNRFSSVTAEKEGREVIERGVGEFDSGSGLNELIKLNTQIKRRRRDSLL